MGERKYSNIGRSRDLVILGAFVTLWLLKTKIFSLASHCWASEQCHPSVKQTYGVILYPQRASALLLTINIRC